MAAKVGLLNAICDKLKTDVNEPEADASPQNTSSSKNGQDTSYCSSTVTVQDLSNHATLDLSTRGTPVQDSHDSPRKNRRKAAAPRCLKSYEEETYQKDDLEEFEANNKDVDFAAYTGDLDENSNQLDDDNDDDRLVDGSDGLNGSESFRNELSDDEDDDGSYARDDSDVDQSPALSPDENSSDERDSKIQDDKPNTDDFGAIDLSVHKSQPKKPRSPSPKVTNRVHVPVNLKVERRLSGSVGKNSGEAADLKDYAESTMNELLSLYGLSEDSGTIAKNVPLQNFSSGRILERHVGGLHNGRPVNRMEAEGRNTHLYAKYAESLSKGFNAEAPLPISNQPPHVVRNHDDYDRDTDTPTSVDASNHAKSGSSKSNSATNSPGNGKFVESAAYIRACFNKDMASEAKSPTELLSGKLLPDYAKYIKRFSGFEDCKGTHCQDMMYREHYHCMDCSFKVFIKKEEMIRHFKWHKKRDESLQHGFMRYSPLDDCEDRFGECTHNKKQTHYHCLQSGCNKVYISTSDVQMHANYHRKDSAIIQEGFQRFRATEDCGTTKCQFYGQRTTHFHCRRHGCDFTFKNKADMEKHKTYHQKDEVLSKDGFKKFMKYEHCSYDGCKYSKISNHIHCIRTGCNYVLHSTGQLYSHKRKHERRDFEFAYKRFKQESGDDKGCSSNDGSSMGGPSDAPSPAPSTQVRPIAPRLGPTPQLPHGLVLPRPLSLPQQRAALFSPAEKALMTAIDLQSQGGKPITSALEQHNDPEYMDLEDLKNFDTKMINSGASTPDSLSPPPTSHPAHPHSKFSLTAEMRRQHLQSAFAFARYASVLKNAELNNSLSLPIPNFMANQRSEEAASHTVTREDARTEVSSDAHSVTSANAHSLTSANAHSVTHGSAVTMPHDDVVVKKERESPVPGPLQVKQELDEVPPPPPPPPGGEQPLLHRALPKIMEKKERDESWKKYMIRYTANDPCRARCSMLYKDHYHCNVEGCDVMFYTKERVREHARLHDQDEKVTELTFHTTMADHPCCVEGCNIDGQKHYHCLWPECDHVIHVTEPPLTRLKHHRYHEQQRTSNNLRWRAERTMPPNEGLLRRKRGRPPKYPKDEIPLVPKVNITENALYETSTPVSVKITREMFVLSSTKIVNGFKMFEAGFPCPDQLCAYFMKEHYHCVRPRCHHVTNSADVMNLHAREFHNYVSIMEGFEFFDRGVNCRRPHCQNNKTNRHFHCVRPRCDYSFVRHSTMFQHDKKHHEGYKLQKPAEEPEKSATSPLDDLKSKTVIKASGTFYPMSTIPLHKPIAPKNSSGIPQPVPIKMEPSLMRPIASIPPFMTNPSSANSTFFVPMASAASMMNLVSMPTAIPIFTAPIMAFPPMTMAAPVIQPPSTPTSTATSGKITLQQASAAAEALKDLESSNQEESNRSLEPSLDPNNPLAGQKSLPLTVLLQQKTTHAPQTESWHNLRSKMHYILNQNCGRPFCKLKKRDHYHCFDCNQAFSDPERLKTHVGRHGIKFERNKQPKLMIKSPGSSRNGAYDDEDSSSHASDLNSSLNLNGEEFSNMMASAQKDIPEIVTNNMDVDEATNDTLDGNYGNLEIDLDSSSEMNSSMEDSNSRRSSRKRTLTRGQEDYVDADAVVVKHRRVTSPRVYKDEPVPDGYTRYWAHEDCGRRGCSYRQSTTHFHCRRKSCGFGICSRIRIEQHTLRHQRIDKITGDDFEQYRANLECGFQKCLYSNQATHFHCLKCSFTCTDTIKVTTHRKQHNKKDFFISQGFQKYSSGQNCKQDCKHNQRQTHYHCIVCGSPVVGQSQMAPHRLKHAGLGRYTLVNMTDSVAAKAKGGKSSSAAVS